MKGYKNYLFDLYGTLVDVHTDEEKPLLWHRMSVLLGMYGANFTPEELRVKYLSEVSTREEEAKGERGPGAEIDIFPVFESFVRKCDDQPDIATLAKIFRVLSLEKLRLFPGALELLQRLRGAGKKVYLLSNAQALFTLPEMHALGIDTYFDGIVISSCEGLKKPDVQFYKQAIERYCLDPNETVMIGNDDQADCWGAARAGLDSMYIYTEQSPTRTEALPDNCRILKRIQDVF